MKPAEPVPSSDTQRIADALLRFEIGLRTHSAGLPVDWSYVAYRMAVALVKAGRNPEAGGAAVIELGPATRRVLRGRAGTPGGEGT